jgi:hypothetical protein
MEDDLLEVHVEAIRHDAVRRFVDGDLPLGQLAVVG